jgi:hypothetical protein
LVGLLRGWLSEVRGLPAPRGGRVKNVLLADAAADPGARYRR